MILSIFMNEDGPVEIRRGVTREYRFNRVVLRL
jgi:hypothetical protein